MDPESSKQGSWGHLGVQARNCAQRFSNGPPGVISETRPENGPRDFQTGLLEPSSSPDQKMGQESSNRDSWSHFRAQDRKLLNRAPNMSPGPFLSLLAILGRERQEAEGGMWHWHVLYTQHIPPPGSGNRYSICMCSAVQYMRYANQQRLGLWHSLVSVRWWRSKFVSLFAWVPIVWGRFVRHLHWLISLGGHVRAICMGSHR